VFALVITDVWIGASLLDGEARLKKLHRIPLQDNLEIRACRKRFRNLSARQLTMMDTANGSDKQSPLE
jgi:hypothetical protein